MNIGRCPCFKTTSGVWAFVKGDGSNLLDFVGLGKRHNDLSWLISSFRRARRREGFAYLLEGIYAVPTQNAGDANSGRDVPTV